MKTVKKSVLLLTAVMMMLSVTACSSGSQEASQASGNLLYCQQEYVVPTPDWIKNLPVAQECDQFILTAGYDKSTAWVSMHEKDKDGNWQMILSSPGYIGKDGLGPADSYHAYTPVGTFTIDKAFGIAPNPGCQLDYIQVDNSLYWSGDMREGMHFNEMVSIDDVPDLDKENSEHLSDYQYQYQYCLNMGFNAECTPGGGAAFFLHCMGAVKPYTGGCVAVPESMMKRIMTSVKPGCKIMIDSLENMGGEIQDPYTISS